MVVSQRRRHLQLLAKRIDVWRARVDDGRGEQRDDGSEPQLYARSTFNVQDGSSEQQLAYEVHCLKPPALVVIRPKEKREEPTDTSLLCCARHVPSTGQKKGGGRQANRVDQQAQRGDDRPRVPRRVGA